MMRAAPSSNMNVMASVSVGTNKQSAAPVKSSMVANLDDLEDLEL